MLSVDDVIIGIDYDDDFEVVVVWIEWEINYEDKFKKKVWIFGCV